MATFVMACKRCITMVAKFQDLNDPSWRRWLFASSNNGRKVWATVLFPRAIMHWKFILYMSVFLFLLPYLQDHGLLRSRNFVSMTTWCNNFSFLQGLHAPWKSLKIAVRSGFWCLLYLSHILKCLKGENYAERPSG